jgi:carbon monoxide dehydrogenase subunit G
MNVEGTHEIRAARERVFAALIDPAILQKCIPGCESLEKSGDNVFTATLKAGVGSIKGKFKGEVRLQDTRPPEHYRLEVDGKGVIGFAKGSANFDLEEQNGVTLIKYSGELHIGGTIAGVGQRMVQSAAKSMAARFFAALEEAVSQ